MTCEWQPDPACLTDEWLAYTDDVKERALRLATSSLQMLTLNRVGTCPVTIRPCAPEPRCGCGWNPHIRNGQGYNNCEHRTPCAPVSEFAIPGPVGYIEALTIDGADVDLWNGDWRLDNGNLLVWQGAGPSPLPPGQDLSKPLTAVGTWGLTYSRSYPVLADGRNAVALLAMEFGKALCKSKSKCSLPRGVTNVARNGVSFTIEAGLFPGGLTGIDTVDAYILKWVPAGMPNRTAQVFNPRNLGNTGHRVSSGIPLRSTI